jgi:hypothetical protein
VLFSHFEVDGTHSTLNDRLARLVADSFGEHFGGGIRFKRDLIVSGSVIDIAESEER